MPKRKINRSDIRMFLDSLPEGMKVSLKDSLTSLTSEQIMEHIENKTRIGKEYYLQIAKALIDTDSKPSADNSDGIIMA